MFLHSRLTMNWLNEPPRWRREGDVLHVSTGEKTDFWRETHYGFIRDDGHLCFETAQGDFTAIVTVTGAYQTLYDQAGLMVRIDERNWLKTGVEFVDGKRLLSCVVTREASDWSIVSGFDAPDVLQIRLTRKGTAVQVEWAPANSTRFETFRLAYFPLSDAVMVGPMCCSPQRAGFEARFEGFHVGPPLERGLHD
jgi:regulation of enolase protein 1 (concanavalin A-like superfamily)